MAKIRYHSLDFDGCLSNENFFNRLEAFTDKEKKWNNGAESATLAAVNQALIESNEAFLSKIAATREGSQDYVLVGSNRQDITMDFMNSAKAGSVFPRIQAVAEHLEATLDKFLLADISSGKGFGTQYDKIRENEYINANGSYKSDTTSTTLNSDKNFASVVDDGSKVSLLVAQVQKASNDHPEDEIEFNFYDDRIDIVTGLNNFFSENPQLIPKNIQLKLHGYSGPQKRLEQQINPKGYPYGEAQLVAHIQGKGSIPQNHEWIQFYKDMRDAVTPPGETSYIQVATEFHYTRLLEHYKAFSSIEQLPKISQEFLSIALSKIAVAERQALSNGSLAQQLIAKDVGHAQAIGREHLFNANAQKFNVKEEFKHLKGDNLKREILLDFKKQLAEISSLSDLQNFEEKNIKNTSDAYKIIAKSQGLTTKILGLQTDSVKAFQQMIKIKESEIRANLCNSTHNKDPVWEENILYEQKKTKEQTPEPSKASEQLGDHGSGEKTSRTKEYKNKLKENLKQKSESEDESVTFSKGGSTP